MTTRPRGGRVVHRIEYDVAAAHPAGINAGTYGELSAVLPAEVDLADEIYIMNSGDNSVWLANGDAASEVKQLPVPLGNSSPDTEGVVIPYPNVFRAGERLSFTPIESSTMDGGTIAIVFMARYKP